MRTSSRRLAELGALVGQAVGTSDWITVTQERIDEFARATGDHQWIHVDPVRAAAGPFGTTIAHGFLTLSLLPRDGRLGRSRSRDVRMGVNYGLNKVRFPAPVPVGSRLRGALQAARLRAARRRCADDDRSDDGARRLGKPVCVAESLSRRYV